MTMQRITRPLTDADRDDRMMLLTSRGEVKRNSEAICDSEYRQALHAGMDEMGQWAVEDSRSLRAGLADPAFYRLAEQERERKLAESVAHYAQCRGISCNQARLPCTERCYPMPEMACAAPEPEPPRGVMLAFRQWLSRMFDSADARLHGLPKVRKA
jgi:hypothetical protein